MVRKLSGCAEDTNNSAPIQFDTATPNKHRIHNDGKIKSPISAKDDLTRHLDPLDRRKAEKVIGLAQPPPNGAYLSSPADNRHGIPSKKHSLSAPGQGIDKMLEPCSWRRPRARSPWACSFLTIGATALSAVFLLFIVHAFLTRQLDPKGCDMCWSRSIYIKFSDFDTEHTRFASKYNLYLHREVPFDEDPKVEICMQYVSLLLR